MMAFVDGAAVGRLPVLSAALLGLLALAELAVELAVDPEPVLGVPRIGAAAGGPHLLLVLLLVLFSLGGTLPVAFPRPAPAGIVASVSVLAMLAIFHTLTAAAMAGELIAGYRLGQGGLPRLAMAVSVPFLVLVLVDPASAQLWVRAVLLASLGPVAALAGTARRARSAALADTAAREAIADTLLEHTARGERARIARELHDVVAHHISIISVQAETARLATPGLPAEGAERLLDIGDTARVALTEMRRLLGVLREDTDGEAGAGGRAGAAARPHPADRHPQPGLRELVKLLDEARNASGTAVRLIVSGKLGTVHQGVELVAYRIVQEALTNARRHAPGAAIDVELHHAAEVLRLRIRDNGPGPSPAARPGGHGLLGMRERATAVGGRVRTGPAAGGGFLVEATLPTKTEAPR